MAANKQSNDLLNPEIISHESINEQSEENKSYGLQDNIVDFQKRREQVKYGTR